MYMKSTFKNLLYSILGFALISYGLSGYDKHDIQNYLYDLYDRNYKSLFEKTDFYVMMLDEYIESYGIRRYFSEEKDYVQDGSFTVCPIGRLVVVEYTPSFFRSKYFCSKEELVKKLKRHYKGDRRVNDVFENDDGGITIDCRH